jgi:hypothetical protein
VLNYAKPATSLICPSSSPLGLEDGVALPFWVLDICSPKCMSWGCRCILDRVWQVWQSMLAADSIAVCRMDDGQMHAVFKHWWRAVQRANRRCVKAWHMHQRRTYVCCFFALVKNVAHHKHKRQRQCAAARCVQRWTCRRCTAVLRDWKAAVEESKQRVEMAEDMCSSSSTRGLLLMVRCWCGTSTAHAGS